MLETACANFWSHFMRDWQVSRCPGCNLVTCCKQRLHLYVRKKRYSSPSGHKVRSNNLLAFSQWCAHACHSEIETNRTLRKPILLQYMERYTATKKKFDWNLRAFLFLLFIFNSYMFSDRSLAPHCKVHRRTVFRWRRIPAHHRPGGFPTYLWIKSIWCAEHQVPTVNQKKIRLLNMIARPARCRMRLVVMHCLWSVRSPQSPVAEFQVTLPFLGVSSFVVRHGFGRVLLTSGL